MNREAILAKQIADWPIHVEGAKGGNPFATLCSHCYGRHGPPHSEICPHDPPFRDRKSERLDRRSVSAGQRQNESR